MLQSAKEFVLDTVFPKFCAGCRGEGTWLCEKCLAEIVFVQSPTCPNCQKLTPKGQFCSRCRSKSNLTGIISACHWREGPLRGLVHMYKYEGIRELADILAAFLIWQLKKNPIGKNTVVMAVPLHWKRQNVRGFNQAQLLAANVATYFNLDLLENALVRTKWTRPQVELKGQQRRTNVRGVFACRNSKKIINNKNILLVDDVATTAATLQEAAKVLRAAGARQVWGVVLAKG